MSRIAIINQRYGKEVNGGSEYYTKKLTEQLSKRHEVEVLTTKALDYNTWINYYKDDSEEIDGIKVKRFAVKFKRMILFQKIVGRLLKYKLFNNIFFSKIWVILQGPYSPELIKYIKENKDNYNVFIFVTYLYFPTVFGMAEVAEKAIFVPTAHEEPYIKFKIFERVFKYPKAIMFLTQEERQLVEKKFYLNDILKEVAGMGIDLPDIVDCSRFRDKYEIRGEYLIYVGRVDIDKGCLEMINYFKQIKEKQPQLHLVIIGRQYMDIEKDYYIHCLGFVSETDKYDGIKGAKALWLPSAHESLSISVLEAMGLSVPVIVNEECDVLYGHCMKSKAGLAYRSYEEFEAIINILDNLQYYSNLCNNGKKYIEEIYNWNYVMNKWKFLLDVISNGE